MKVLYSMPAEWEEHTASLVSWPIKSSLVYSNNYEEVCKGYAQVINAIMEFEPVYVLINDATADIAKRYCHKKVDYLNIDHDDAWIRDNGPTYVRNRLNGKNIGINWRFNAWGEKYPEFELDNKVAVRVNEALKVKNINVDLVLEGGSIHVDGEGTLLTTKECLLNRNRNPNMRQESIEKVLKNYLGVEKIIWLNKGLYGDETDGHIDNIACFAKPQTIVVQTCKDESDPNYNISQEAITLLKQSKDAQGRPINIVEIEGPPIRHYKGKRLTLSYLNFYLVNKGLILPVFGKDAEEYDRKAINSLRSIYPDRKIVTIDGIPLIKEGGNVHCITQQIPKEVKWNA